MATRAPALGREVHLSHRSNWLRAAVLGANDGIVSTASLVLGVVASGASSTAIVTAGIAGLVAGALSMAAGEYVSVSSQRDAEQADAAAADIAADAGALVERKPFRPVLRGRLLTGSGPRYMRYDAGGGDGEGEAAPHTLWWPPSKVNGRYLAPWLAARDEEAVADHLPQAGGLAVQTDLHRDYIAS
jgi:VIT family protein